MAEDRRGDRGVEGEPIRRPARYAEHRPHPRLRDRVQCYWSYRGILPARPASIEAVLPDACMDFLFDVAAGTAHLVGTMTRPLRVRRAGSMDLLGIRFRPGAITAVVDLAAAELTDSIVPLGEALGPAAGPLLERLRATSASLDRIAALDRMLLVEVPRPSPGGDAAVLAATGILAGRAGAVRIGELAAAVGLGRRQFERRFLHAVGIPPKAAARVIRFQAALARMLASPETSLSAVAFSAGYHDQAHFTRDFGAFAGEAPGAYRARRAGRGAHVAFLQDTRGSPAYVQA